MKNQTSVQSLPLKKLRIDGGTQMRVSGTPEVWAGKLAVQIQEQGHNLNLQPGIAFYDGREYWLADGLIRHRALALAGERHMFVDVRHGSRRDAVLFAAGKNARMILTRSDEDKWFAVETLLRDEEWGHWTDAELARRANVSDRFVAKVRKAVSPNGSGMRKVERQGVIYQMNVANMAAKPSERSLADVVETLSPDVLAKWNALTPEEQEAAWQQALADGERAAAESRERKMRAGTPMTPDLILSKIDYHVCRIQELHDRLQAANKRRARALARILRPYCQSLRRSLREREPQTV